VKSTVPRSGARSGAARACGPASSQPGPIRPSDRSALDPEADALLRFVEPQAMGWEVMVAG
jgi:hypothetical protein